jgi:hypothetical protein
MCCISGFLVVHWNNMSGKGYLVYEKTSDFEGNLNRLNKGIQISPPKVRSSYFSFGELNH